MPGAERSEMLRAFLSILYIIHNRSDLSLLSTVRSKSLPVSYDVAESFENGHRLLTTRETPTSCTTHHMKNQTKYSKKEKRVHVGHVCRCRYVCRLCKIKIVTNHSMKKCQVPSKSAEIRHRLQLYVVTPQQTQARAKQQRGKYDTHFESQHANKCSSQNAASKPGIPHTVGYTAYS